MSDKKSRSAAAMQRLRDTFRRSRGGQALDLPPAAATATAASAPVSTASSLEVPKQVRSVSFDEIRLQNSVQEPEEEVVGFLEVPASRNQRSRSFDSATVTAPGSLGGAAVHGSLQVVLNAPPTLAVEHPNALEVPRWRLLRRASSEKSQSSAQCIHCLYLEELERQRLGQSPQYQDRTSFYVSSGSETNDSDTSQKEDFLDEDEEEDLMQDMICPVRVTLSVHGSPPPTSPDSPVDQGLGITVVSLEVPLPTGKQVRSASVDSSFLKVPSPEDEIMAAGGAKTYRSRSVDIVLPTGSESGYVLQAVKKAIQGDIKISTENGESRNLQSTPDWGESAVNGDHLWIPTSASGDMCYVGESECSKSGPRMKCPACKVIVHTGCISILVEKTRLACKPTFKDVGIRQYREQTGSKHHWVHRRHQKGKCNFCGKSFQSKLSFGSKEIVAISCTWCKASYHNKETCFNMSRFEETCNLGLHANIIVPPSWIVKLPRKGSFKSSIRRSPKKRASTKRKSKKEGEKDQVRTFAIKPIPSANSKPLLVFINPKSGGNQGAKLMQKFQWLLNPRQVFDLSAGGPLAGLELYRKVPNLRILACGGDGTVGWVLSILDQIGISPFPPIAILPLGTGNDLARSLGWGGGYTDEPIFKILINTQEGEVTQLDRWDLQVDTNQEVDLSTCEEGKPNLPMNVVNNYFSLGVDAHIALEFHEAREAHPERFNSRLRNKMFYGQAGGKDLLQRKWKDLCNYVTLECDGQDLTMRLRELKVHSILFLNIPSYGGGTRPWGNVGPTLGMQNTDDALIEVIGLTTYQLPFLQAGGHGTCLAQCRHAVLVTSRTIPMQVDGEPCKLLPSVIELRLRNQANMIAKAKARPCHHPPLIYQGRHGHEAAVPLLEKLTLDVRRLNMAEYENYHYDKDKLKELSTSLGQLCVNQDTDLELVRVEVNKLANVAASPEVESSSAQTLSPDWCFLDSCTAERFFRIDHAQEHLHYVVDICVEELYVLDPEGACCCLSGENPLLTTSGDSSQGSSLATLDQSSNESVGPNVNGKTSLLGVHEPNNNNHHHPPPTINLPVQDEPTSCMDTYNEVTPVESSEVILASKTNNLKRLKELHASGFDLLSVDCYGLTALHHAACFGLVDIVQYLLTCAPQSMLDMVDNESGQTALHKAAKYKQPKVCCMLVSAGASLLIRDKQGLNARHLASAAGDEDLVAYLKDQEIFQQSGLKEKETTV